MKKTIFLTISLLFISVPLMIQAESNPIYQVSTDNLNVREGPSYQSDILAQLNEGDQVKVFDELYGWVKTYLDGKEVWIAKHYLIKLDHRESELDHKHITIEADHVNIRSGPGTEHQVIKASQSGETFQVLNAKGSWNKIKLDNGQIGWVAGYLTNQSSGASTPTANALDGYNIVLDLGHGGRDVGAIGFGGVFEKDLLLQTGLSVAEELREAGATVILSRQDDSYLSLERRAELSNSYNTHAFISLHFDSYTNQSASGTTVFHNNSADLASSLHHSMKNYNSLKSRGIQPALYKVLTHTEAPAALIELGFISNPSDLSIIQTAQYQKEVSESIKNGLIDYLH